MTQIDSKVPKIRFNGFDGEWKEKAFIEITTKIGSGKTPRGGDASYVLAGVPLIRSQNIANNSVSFEKVVFITKDIDDEMVNSRVKKNDVLLNITGASIGRSAVYRLADRANVNQHVCIIRPTSEFGAEFIQLHLASSKGQRSIDNNQAGGAREGLNFQQIGGMKFNYPSRIEQTKIGEYFRELDTLIGLHQCKYDKLVTLKKAMLQKMFAQAGASFPEIRFSGFSENWVEKKLCDLTCNISNNTLSRAELNYQSGVAKNIHYGDILVKFGEVLDVQSRNVPFINADSLPIKLNSSSLKDGDIVLADAAEDEMVGKCTEIHNVRDQIVMAGLHTIALRPLYSFAPFYLGYYLNSDSFHNQLLRLMQGTKVLSISKSVIKDVIVCFPSELEEQKKIGSYFRSLDELISKHAIQLQKLKQIKSACLEKMFV